MDRYLPILKSLSSLSSHSTIVEEWWGYINITGNYFTECLGKIISLKRELSDLGLNNVLKVNIDNDEVESDDIEDYQETKVLFIKWQIRLNKLPIVELDNNGSNYNFFITSEACRRWISTINPISDTCPILAFPTIKIIVSDLKHPFGGEKIQFLPLEKKFYNLHYKGNTKLPSIKDVQEALHTITSDKILVDCNAYYINDGVYTTPLGEEFISKACIVLATSIVNEYYSFDKIVIDGIKRLPIRLVGENAKFDILLYQQLIELVEWIYADRVSVRKKLFHERLSLDINPNISFIDGLEANLGSALLQAKERYSFVIIDRKDAYVKELKELLKDVKGQSELYSVKIRTLLSNFLRDLLAALLLIGFTIFTKFSDNATLEKNKLLETVFYALGIYYLFSITMQIIVDITDIRVSKKEILYWKNTTKELIPEKEFTNHISESLRGRRMSLYVIYPLISCCYAIIAYACFNFPEMFRNLSK